MQEIERKFLVTALPNLVDKTPLAYERYFLYIGETFEIRIQKKGDQYEFERKGRTGVLMNEKTKFAITKDEFEHLKQFSTLSLQRESYDLGNHASIKIYHGTYEGLIRAEFEFDSETAVRAFTPPSWCGPEITNHVLGRDAKLIHLSTAAFQKALSSCL